MLALSSNGVNLLFTNFNETRAYMTTSPKAVSGAGGGAGQRLHEHGCSNTAPQAAPTAATAVCALAGVMIHTAGCSCLLASLKGAAVRTRLAHSWPLKTCAPSVYAGLGAQRVIVTRRHYIVGCPAGQLL